MTFRFIGCAVISKILDPTHRTFAPPVTTDYIQSCVMCETWVKPNRRAILFGCVPPLIAGTAGVWLVFGLEGPTSSAWRWIGYLLVAAALLVISTLLKQLTHPRIGFRDGNVLFYLRGAAPIAVPVAIVESFFSGQGPAHIPAMANQPNTVNLVARLSQRHKEWAQQYVRPSLGKWCEGYVTIRGTWCEPLSSDMIRTLNRRLKEVKDIAGSVSN